MDTRANYVVFKGDLLCSEELQLQSYLCSKPVSLRYGEKGLLCCVIKGSNVFTDASTQKSQKKSTEKATKKAKKVDKNPTKNDD